MTPGAVRFGKYCPVPIHRHHDRPNAQLGTKHFGGCPNGLERFETPTGHERQLLAIRGQKIRTAVAVIISQPPGIDQN